MWYHYKRRKVKSQDRLVQGWNQGAAEMERLKTNSSYTFNNSIKIIIIMINAYIGEEGISFQLLLFFSDVRFCCALPPQFGTRLVPHEMRSGHWWKWFHMARWSDMIGWEMGRTPLLLVPFHSPPANCGKSKTFFLKMFIFPPAKAKWNKNKRFHAQLQLVSYGNNVWVSTWSKFTPISRAWISEYRTN